jgi:diguanylate cyclase
MQATDLDEDRRSRTDRRGETRWPVRDQLIAALERGEIEILFQPQFAVADGAILGAEALARWQSPTMGRIGAAELFGIAERADHVEAVTRHIARAALRVAAGWPERLRLSINVTAADVAQPGFARSIARKVAEAGFAPQRLTLEITEQSLLAELPLSAGRLRLLTDLGIRIALDDFGAGFCNFRYLKHLPLHYLKLDRSMVEGIDEDPRDLAVLRGILAMAKALELEVIAEGIERAAQLEAVVREGSAGWQGFLGAEPMSAAEFAEFAVSRS